MPQMPKTFRYTLGEKIDMLFIETTEAIHTASYMGKDEKLPLVKTATIKLDGLKFFLEVAWELRAIDTKKYGMISDPLAEIGRMLGGWLRKLDTTKTKPNLL